MKRTLELLLALLLPAVFCLPSFAEGGDAAKEGTSAEAKTGPAAAKPAAKKPAPKKKKKKKPAAPVSEYKFSAVESVPTYKFDRKADPIVKTPPKKKKGAKKTSPKPAAPSDGESSGQAEGQ